MAIDRLTHAQRYRIEQLAVENIYLTVEAGCELTLEAAIEALVRSNAVLTEMIAEHLAARGKGNEALRRVVNPHTEEYLSYLQAMIAVEKRNKRARKNEAP
jgi:hypothetical protein